MELGVPAYRGQCSGGAKEGRGVAVLGNQDVYAGEWKSNTFHGGGTYTFADGTTYDGEWANGKQEGRGKATFPNGDTFDGNWHNGLLHGRGSFISRNFMFHFDGEWAKGKPEGEGKVVWKSSAGDAELASYTGGWKNGKFDGRGILRRSDGYAYCGEWANGVPHGKGSEETPMIAGKEIFEGKFSHGIRDGPAKITLNIEKPIVNCVIYNKGVIVKEQLCLLCGLAPKSMVCDPCGHVYSCLKCMENPPVQCFICHKKVAQVLQIQEG